MKTRKFFDFLFILFFVFIVNLFAQDKQAKIALSFEKRDSVNIIKARVTSNDSTVKDLGIKLYVQRMYSLLPVGGSQSTDDEGIVNFEFPKDIPADIDGKLTIIAKIEDDENYANAETKSKIDWGVPRKSGGQKNAERSLSASGSRAPIYFIVVSNLIIIGIWGTLIYVILQVFKIKKLSKHLNK